MAHNKQDQQATAARHPPVPVPLPLPLLPPPMPPPPHQGHHIAFEQGVMQHARPGTSSGRVLVVQRQSLDQHVVDQQDASPPHAHLEQTAGCGPAIPPLPSAPSSAQQPHNYKTQLCRRWQAGFCALGGRCTFAHGNEELRSMPDRPTVTCRYWQSGHCKAGDRCHFLHGTPEAQQQQQQEAQHSQQQRQPHPQSQPWQDASQGAQQGNGQAAAWPELASERVPAQQRPAPAHDLVARDPAVLVATLQGTHLSGPGSSGATPAAHPQQEALPGTSSGAGSGKQGSAAPCATTSSAPPAPQLSEEMAGVLQRRFGSLLCPITLEPFVDPVVAADGNIYERHAIDGWLYRDGNNASPLTNGPLAHKMLMPCGIMRRCIAEVAEFVAAMQRQVL